jgi:hypothetical protein
MNPREQPVEEVGTSREVVHDLSREQAGSHATGKLQVASFDRVVPALALPG